MMVTKKTSEQACGTCCSSVKMFLSLVASAIILGVIVVGGLYWVEVMNGTDSSNSDLSKIQGDIEALRGDLSTFQSRLDGLSASKTEDDTKAVSLLDETISAKLGESTSILMSKYPFSVLDIEVGDSLGDFTVKSIKPYDASDDLSNTNASVRLTGQAIVSGRYEYYGSTSEFAGQVCITDLDDESATLLPNIKNRENVLICFTNNDVAQQLFGPKGSVGNGTFTIDDYTINVSGDDETISDMSTLVKATKDSVAE